MTGNNQKIVSAPKFFRRVHSDITILRALVLFIQTLALYKSFTYLLTYLLNISLHLTKPFRCGGIVNDDQYITDVLLSVPVEGF